MVRRGGGIVSSLLTTGSKLLSEIPVGKVVNTVIDALPVELHIPFYQYCGPGTKLEERIARGDPGINELDRACKDHDIAYSKSSDLKIRSTADKILADSALKRITAGDASFGERAAALAVVAGMKAKTAFGGGGRRVKKRKQKKSPPKRGRGIKNKRNHKSRKNLIAKKKKNVKSVWTVIKSGKGVYLKPYQNVY